MQKDMSAVRVEYSCGPAAKLKTSKFKLKNLLYGLDFVGVYKRKKKFHKAIEYILKNLELLGRFQRSSGRQPH